MSSYVHGGAHTYTHMAFIQPTPDQPSNVNTASAPNDADGVLSEHTVHLLLQTCFDTPHRAPTKHHILRHRLLSLPDFNDAIV